jgi:hypothetical protein
MDAKEKRTRRQERKTGTLRHGIVGPEPVERDRFRERVQLEEAAFLKKGSKLRGGTFTARETGARSLAIRHFEELVRKVRVAATRSRRRREV